MPVIDQQWRALSKEQRDILVAIARAGPASGADIHRRVRGEDSSQTEGTTHRNLQALTARGLTTREQIDGREYRYELTDAGREAVRAGILEPASEINVQRAGESDE